MENNKFEDAFSKLENMSDQIKASDTNLEDSIKCYEEGMKYYNICNEILTKAKQKIEIFEGEV